ncbi:histidine kinase [Arcobacter sp. CECT 8983]|uniref:sensor histidine kinase n=1 Tax=Arcobacter sp. CECT 8983 TaxID=2044508 RepID=UPI00100B16D6|nr:sensor histidine kinase [Arcobacter sp. CECT 8983]RXJ90344.1 histidine kinase [Arcobacter sp. CECT 8983]
MTKVLTFKHLSFNAKISASLFLLALILISILLALIIPKMQKEAYEKTINEIEKVLSITQEQIKLAGEAIVIQSELETELIKKDIENEIEKLKNKIINSNLDFNEIKMTLKKNKKLNNYYFSIKYKKDVFTNQNSFIYKEHKIKSFDTWQKYNTKYLDRTYSSHIKYYSYSSKIKNYIFSVFCTEEDLNPNHEDFEKKIKKYVQKTFDTTANLHKGKTYLFWLNSKYLEDDSEPLFQKKKSKKEKKYTISNISNVSNIFTGNLTAKQIMQASKKNFVEHKHKNKAAISWVRDLYGDKYKNYTLLLIKTVYKEDLLKNVDSTLKKILPATFIALILALLLAFFLFKRLFKTINTLTYTAKEVNKGNKKIRSLVSGNDDIGNLGRAFDSMLNSFEENIKILDTKVEEKTKELQNSLLEKEILLKEIHHRVKNNLALTISLIKLQENKIKDKNTQTILNDIQERIYTMELLHRKLYESSNLNSICFKEYVENLLEDISYTYDIEKKVEYKIDIEKIVLNIEIAMPCALILNELITNSFKYAFKDNPKPKLEISMKKTEKGTLLLIHKDNGKGLSKQIDLETSETLGLKLINSISKFQLDGQITYSYEKGAVFKIEF